MSHVRPPLVCQGLQLPLERVNRYKMVPVHRPSPGDTLDTRHPWRDDISERDSTPSTALGFPKRGH